jgi:hypothetical protein
MSDIRKTFELKIHDVIAEDLRSGLLGTYSDAQIIQYICRNSNSIQCCLDDIMEEIENDESFEPDKEWIREYLGECNMRR